MKHKKLLRKLLFIFIGFIIFIWIMDQLIMPWYTKHGDEYELPDVTEQPVPEAVDLLESEGFDPRVVDSVYDANYAPGVVVRQSPLPYTTVKKGRRIYLVVSIGEKPIYMPSLIGATVKDAEFQLTDRALRLNRVIYEFSEFYPNGVVINQSVPAGNNVERNQKINVTVSLGPPPASKEVPNLVGKSLTYVRKELETIGIPIGQIKYQYRPNLVPETVVGQSISAGTPAAKVDSIDVTISTDKPIKKPEKEEEKSDQENQTGETSDG
jgi:beta-lactam-binding protein with PASTA domain